MPVPTYAPVYSIEDRTSKKTLKARETLNKKIEAARSERFEALKQKIDTDLYTPCTDYHRYYQLRANMYALDSNTDITEKQKTFLQNQYNHFLNTPQVQTMMAMFKIVAPTCLFVLHTALFVISKMLVGFDFSYAIQSIVIYGGSLSIPGNEHIAQLHKDIYRETDLNSATKTVLTGLSVGINYWLTRNKTAETLLMQSELCKLSGAAMVFGFGYFMLSRITELQAGGNAETTVKKGL